MSRKRFAPMVIMLLAIALIAGIISITYGVSSHLCSARGGHLTGAGNGWICVTADGRVLG